MLAGLFGLLCFQFLFISFRFILFGSLLGSELVLLLFFFAGHVNLLLLRNSGLLRLRDLLRSAVHDTVKIGGDLNVSKLCNHEFVLAKVRQTLGKVSARVNAHCLPVDVGESGQESVQLRGQLDLELSGAAAVLALGRLLNFVLIGHP